MEEVIDISFDFGHFTEDYSISDKFCSLTTGTLYDLRITFFYKSDLEHTTKVELVSAKVIIDLRK